MVIKETTYTNECSITLPQNDKTKLKNNET